MTGWARPSERLTALSLLALSAVAALSGGAGAGRLLALAGLLLLGWLLARTGAQAGPLGWLRDAAIPAMVLPVFLLLQPIIEAAHPARLDGALSALEARWLDGVPAAWFGLLGRPAWLVDVAYLAYFSFYLLPVGVAVAARLRRGGEALERVVFPVVLCFHLSFLGYFLWPASGPRVVPALEDAILGGGAAARAVRAFLRAAEATTLDAFPSGHTAVSLVAARQGARIFPRARAALWGWAAAIVFATVYVSAHYVVDVLAGVALAALVVVLAAPVGRALAGAREGRRPPG